MKTTVIEIVEHATLEVIKTVDVTGKSKRLMDKVDDGINRNLNHEEYFTRIAEIEAL